MVEITHIGGHVNILYEMHIEVSRSSTAQLSILVNNNMTYR